MIWFVFLGANSVEINPETPHPVVCILSYVLLQCKISDFAKIANILTGFKIEAGLQVIEMPEHNQGDLGGTMRLGKRKTVFKGKHSIASKFLLFSSSKKCYWKHTTKAQFSLFANDIPQCA